MTEMIHFADEAISTEYSALMSKVVTERQRPDQVPDQRARRGQAQVADRRVPRLYGGPGAQHIAVATRDIVRAVTEMRERGIEFLSVPTPTTTRSGADRRDRGVDRGSAAPRHPGRPRRRGLHAADLPQAVRIARRCFSRSSSATAPRLWGGQLQGALRGDRARAGAEGEPLIVTTRWVGSRRSGRPVPRPRRVPAGNGTAPLLVEEVLRLEGFGATCRSSFHLWSASGSQTSASSRPIETRGVGARRICAGSRTRCAAADGRRVLGRRVLQYNADVEIGICIPRPRRLLLPRRRGRRGHLRPRGRGRGRDDLRHALLRRSTTTS